MRFTEELPLDQERKNRFFSTDCAKVITFLISSFVIEIIIFREETCGRNERIKITKKIPRPSAIEHRLTTATKTTTEFVVDLSRDQ